MKFIAAAVAGLYTVEGRCDFDLSHHLTGGNDTDDYDQNVTDSNKVVNGVRKI
jgi:hypothetical protein